MKKDFGWDEFTAPLARHRLWFTAPPSTSPPRFIPQQDGAPAGGARPAVPGGALAVPAGDALAVPGGALAVPGDALAVPGNAQRCPAMPGDARLPGGARRTCPAMPGCPAVHGGPARRCPGGGRFSGVLARKPTPGPLESGSVRKMQQNAHNISLGDEF